MHGHGVYHCDIKPGNLLLTSNDYRHADIVICDFGLSVVFSDGEKQTVCAHSHFYLRMTDG